MNTCNICMYVYVQTLPSHVHTAASSSDERVRRASTVDDVDNVDNVHNVPVARTSAVAERMARMAAAAAPASRPSSNVGRQRVDNADTDEVCTVSSVPTRSKLPGETDTPADGRHTAHNALVKWKDTW